MASTKMALRLDMAGILAKEAADPATSKRIRARFAQAVKAINLIDDDKIRGPLREKLRSEYERQIETSSN